MQRKKDGSTRKEKMNKVRYFKQRLTWRRLKLDLMVWLANGQPYAINTSVRIEDVTFIGKPAGRPMLTMESIRMLDVEKK